MKKKQLFTALAAASLFFSMDHAAAANRIAFGDSNTAGTTLQAAGLDDQYYWTNRAAAINEGIGGNTTVHAVNRFNRDVLSQKPTEVTLMFGTNDAVLLPNGEPKVNKAEFEQNMRYMVQELKKRKVKVVLMTTIPVIQSFFYERNDASLYAPYGGVRLWQDSYNNIVRRLAKEERVRLIDNYANAIHKAGSGTDGGLYASGLIDLTGTHWTARGADMIAYSVQRVLGR